MGRSVAYLHNAERKIFFEFESEFEEQWNDILDTIRESMSSVAPSLDKPSRDRWDGRETFIILANDHAEVGIAEYCGLVSISIRVNEYDQYYTGNNALSIHWIEQMWQPMVIAMMKNGMKFYDKEGTFSNGEGVYGLIDSKLYEYNYLKQFLLGSNAFTVVPKRPGIKWKRFNELSLSIHSDLKR